MDNRDLMEWISESRSIQKLSHNSERVLFIENYSRHKANPEVDLRLRNMKKDLKEIPPNETNFFQPADLLVISKIKDEWRRGLDNNKESKIARGSWMGSGAGDSRKIKSFYFRLAAAAVREVNTKRNKIRLSFDRKDMIRTGIYLNFNGVWEEQKIFPTSKSPSQITEST